MVTSSLFLLLPLLLVCQTLSFSCFPESEQKTLYYQNRPDKIIDDLPTIRLIQGFWPSMLASQYIAYIFLTEKMGVNVSFFPSDDPNVYNGTSYSYKMRKSSKICEYPEWFFCFMDDNKADLLFEMWPLLSQREYLQQNGSVLFGGYSGVFAEQAIYIPKYLATSYVHSIIPYDLRYNESLRQAMIDSYTINGDINWYNEIKNIRQKNFNDTWPFDVLNESRPTIFSSVDTYLSSTHFYNITHNIPIYDGFGSLGLEMNFITFGNELNLSNLLIDLYNKQLPFIVGLYSPHYDFATPLSNNSSQVMEFERITLPRNPSNSIKDECYPKGQCTTPLELLYKIGRKKLLAEFPEIIYFLNKYALDSTDINTVLKYYTNISDYDNSNENLRWLKASCKWLKENFEEIEHKWFVNIRRDFYPIYKYDKNSKIGFTVVFLLIIIVLIHSILWMLKNVKYKLIAATAPYMSIVMTIGLVFICIGNIIYIYQPMDLIKCNLYEYFINIGLVLSISTPLLKSYRMVMIISKANNLKQILIKDKHLIQYLLIITGVVMLPLIMYTVLSIKAGTKKKTIEDHTYNIIVCNKNYQLTYLQSVIDIYIFVLLFSMVILSWNSKSAAKLLLFKETTCTIFSSFLSLFSYFILFAFKISTQNYDIIITVQSLLYMTCIIIIWLLYYGRIIKKFYNKPVNKRELSSRHLQHLETQKDIKNTIHGIQNDAHRNKYAVSMGKRSNDGNYTPENTSGDEIHTATRSPGKITLSKVSTNSNDNHLISPFGTPDNSLRHKNSNDYKIEETAL